MSNKRRSHNRSRAETSSEEEARRAFLQIEPRLGAIEEKEVMKPNINVPRAVAVVLAAEPRIRKLLKQIRRELPRFDVRLVHELRTIALATWYVHVTPRPTLEDDLVKRLVAEGAPLKRKLLTHAKSLAEQKIVASEQIAAIEAGRGHLDLVALATLFRERWSVVSKNLKFVEEGDLVRAAEIGTSLLEALGVRDVGSEESTSREQAAITRWRAFTLLVKSYDEVRTAVAYVRRKEGDVDAIAPSLYLTRGRGRIDAALSGDVAPSIDTTPSIETTSSIDAAPSVDAAPVAPVGAIGRGSDQPPVG